MSLHGMYDVILQIGYGITIQSLSSGDKVLLINEDKMFDLDHSIW